MPGSPLVIGLGEVLWDLFPDAQKPGGAPANVAFQAGQLGGRGAVASRVGIGKQDQYADELGNLFDRLGDRLVAYLGERDLDLTALQRDPEHPTGCVTVDVSDPHHPRYIIHENAAWDFIAADRPLLDLAARADAICFGSLAQRSPASRSAIHATLRAARPECLIVFDVNLRQQWWDLDVITASMTASDIIKLNHDEVATLAPLMNAPAEPLAFARHVQQEYVETVCITRAEQGCLLVRGRETVDLPGLKVNVVDAVGAGDAFSAALIIATLRNWPLQNTGELANRVGALVASRPGAMPDLRAEFTALLSELSPQ
jgi:fructokinase